MEQIGARSFGKVYQATKEDGTDVALKVVSVPEVVSPSIQQQIANELYFLEDLDHKNIVSFHDSFLIGDAVGIEMELMGHTLLEVIHTFQQTETEIAYFVRNILEGLAYLHQKGIIFRDLHTGNVMLNSLGEVKLVDFGLAALYQPPMSSFPGDKLY
jgi:serine/threonine protein kinase